MGLVYYVPGFGGSVLADAADPSDVYWAEFSILALGRTPVFGLAADGVSPAAPWGIALSPTGLLPRYYGAAVSNLAAQLSMVGWSVVPFAWDWRKDMAAAGQLLALTIMSQVSAADPCCIVAHSAGGLVARAAYHYLVAAGQDAKVKRLITCATPHYGTYSAYFVMIGNSVELLATTLLVFVAGLIVEIPPVPHGYLALTVDDVSAIVRTWPALYQLLPFVGAPDVVHDPNRPLLYTAANWHSYVPSQALLTQASTVWDVLMSQASSVPPPWKMTMIAGSGLATPGKLFSPTQLGTIYAVTENYDGDGTAPSESALGLLGWQYTYMADHQGVILAPILDGTIAKEVLIERSAPTPPPPVDAETVPYPNMLGTPPFADPGFGQRQPPLSAGGDC